MLKTRDAGHRKLFATVRNLIKKELFGYDERETTSTTTILVEPAITLSQVFILWYCSI